VKPYSAIVNDSFSFTISKRFRSHCRPLSHYYSLLFLLRTRFHNKVNTLPTSTHNQEQELCRTVVHKSISTTCKILRYEAKKVKSSLAFSLSYIHAASFSTFWLVLKFWSCWSAGSRLIFKPIQRNCRDECVIPRRRSTRLRWLNILAATAFEALPN